jgi:hypothetical protein
MPRKKKAAAHGTGSKRVRNNTGVWTAPDGTRVPLNGRHWATVASEWKRSGNGGHAGADSAAGNEAASDGADGQSSDDGSSLSFGDSDGTGTGTDNGSGDDTGSPRVIRRRSTGGRKKQTGTRQKTVVSSLDLEDGEDVKKIALFLLPAFGTIATVRQYPGWQISEEDALSLARPIHELGKRYPELAGKIIDASPAVTLALTAAWIIGPRVAADVAFQKMKATYEAQQRAAAQQAQKTPTYTGPQVVPPQPTGEQPASRHGGTETGFPKDLNMAANMWGEDASKRDYDGLPVA